MSLLLCLGIVVLWILSERVECYAWAGQTGSRSAVIALELGHVIVCSRDDWPSGFTWHFAAERLSTHSYRVGVAYENRAAAMFRDPRDFNNHGIVLIHTNGRLIMPPAAGAAIASYTNVTTLRISLAWPVAITAVLPVVHGAKRVLKMLRAYPPGYCPTCGYSLTGNTSGVCPGSCKGDRKLQR